MGRSRCPRSASAASSVPAFVIPARLFRKAGPAGSSPSSLAGDRVCVLRVVVMPSSRGRSPSGLPLYAYATSARSRLGVQVVSDAGVRRLQSAVAVGWGQYLKRVLAAFGIAIPPEFAQPLGGRGGEISPPSRCGGRLHVPPASRRQRSPPRCISHRGEYPKLRGSHRLLCGGFTPRSTAATSAPSCLWVAGNGSRGRTGSFLHIGFTGIHRGRN